jgi:hypothetical protein
MLLGSGIEGGELGRGEVGSGLMLMVAEIVAFGMWVLVLSSCFGRLLVVLLLLSGRL